ncbi:MAG: hypothetical protein AAGE01_18930, partial [Pseudomonadota bacterium]
MKYLKYGFCLAALLLIAATAGAQPEPDTRFTYQGVLQDLTGDAVEYDFMITLYDGPDALAIPLGAPNELLGVGVVDGVFVLELDFGADIFGGSERWLELAVRRGGETAFQTLSPRQRVAAVPVAMVADLVDWDALAGVPAGFADGADDDLMASLNCADGETVAFSDL